MTSFRLRRRSQPIAAALAALGLLAGCSSKKETNWGDMFTMLSQAWAGHDSGVTRDQAAATPFASIGIRIGDSSEAMLVLASSNGEERLWTAASHIVLLIRGGRIVRTAGLDYNLGDLRNLRGVNAAPPTQGSSDTVWSADFPDLHVFSVPIACHSTVRGPESIKILGSTVATVHVDEDCRSETLDWSFTNSYWIAPQSRLVWRSIQNISPKLDALEVRILRPPAS